MSRGSMLRLGILALLWGASFLFIKVGLTGLSPVQIVVARMTTGAAVLLIVVRWQRTPLPRSPTALAHLTFAALVANLAPYFLFGWAEQRVDSSLAGTLNSTTPLFTLVIAFCTGTERRMTAQRVGGLILGFIGAALVIGPWRAGSGSIAGELACLGAATCYGVGFVYMRRYLTGRGISPLGLAAAQLSIGAVMLGVAAPFVAAQAVRLTAPVVASAIALGALGTGIAYLLNYRLIQDEGATSASTVTYLIPVVAVILGMIILSEPVSWNLFVGAPIVLVGVALSENRLPSSAITARRDQRVPTGYVTPGSRH